jgi:hypothetical protein
VGTGSFWTEMINYVRNGPSSLDAALKKVEDSWPD